MSAQWKALSKVDIKRFLYIFSNQRNIKRLRTLGQTVGYSVKGFCIGMTGGSLVGYPAAVSGKSMQPIFNYPTRREPTFWEFSCLPVPEEPFSDNMWEVEEEVEEWDDEEEVLEGVPFLLKPLVRLLLEFTKSLWTQDWVWVSTFAARNYKFVPGDIVVYVSPKDPTDCLIKRVIGLEGDIISSDRYKVPHLLIPEGRLWLEGDNWGNSVDSNKYGPVSKGLVFGVATAVIWPPSRWELLERGTLPKHCRPERVVSINRVGIRGREESGEGEGLVFYWRVLKNFLRVS